MINIYRAGRKAFCEPEQLELMKDAGWTTDANAMKAKIEVGDPVKKDPAKQEPPKEQAKQ